MINGCQASVKFKIWFLISCIFSDTCKGKVCHFSSFLSQPSVFGDSEGQTTEISIQRAVKSSHGQQTASLVQVPPGLSPLFFCFNNNTSLLIFSFKFF